MNEPSVEEEMARLEALSSKISDESTPLDEALAAFEEANRLAVTLKQRLKSYEQKIENASLDHPKRDKPVSS